MFQLTCLLNKHLIGGQTCEICPVSQLAGHLGIMPIDFHLNCLVLYTSPEMVGQEANIPPYLRPSAFCSWHSGILNKVLAFLSCSYTQENLMDLTHTLYGHWAIYT